MKRWITWAAALALLLLTACSGGEAEGSTDRLARAAGLDADEALLTVDGQEQPPWRYLYWLARACSELRSRYEQAGQTLDWDAPMPEGGTLADYAKARALEDTALCVVVEQWAQIYGCAQPETVNGKGFESELLTAEQAAALAKVGEDYHALYALYSTPDSLLAPVEGELELYARQEGILWADRILIRFGDDREGARQKIEALFTQLNGAAEQEAVFEELAASGDDPAGPRLWEQAEVGGALWLAASELAEGQTSGILEAEDGYSIILRLPTDENALAAEYFDYLLLTAARECEIEPTSACETLSVTAFLEALRRLQP